MRVGTLGGLGAGLALRHNHYGVGSLGDQRHLLPLLVFPLVTLGFIGTIMVLHRRSFRR